MWHLGVCVGTLDSDSSDRGSNPREAGHNYIGNTHAGTLHALHMPQHECEAVRSHGDRETASFFDAIKQTEHRNITGNACEQKESRLHVSLVWIRTCNHCVAHLLAAQAKSLSDDTKSVLVRLTFLSLRVSLSQMHMSGHPGSNQGSSYCCRHLQL